MAISKVILNGVTQIDLTQDTVNAASSLSGVTGHSANGESFTGTYTAITPTGTISITQNGTIDVTQYASANVNVQPTYTATVVSTTGTATIQINSGERITLTNNATYTFKENDTIIVRVVDGEGIYYNETLVAFNNGYTVSYTFTAPASNLQITVVNASNMYIVEDSSTTLITKNIIENGTYSASNDNADGYSQVIVNVPSGGTDTSDATMTSGDQMLSGVTAYANGTKYTGTIATKTSSDLTASGATVTVPAGFYASQVTKSVTSGTAGTPTATKGTVSNNSISITPSVTNTTGYITGETKTGTAVTVSASELVSGTYSVTSSGTKDVTNYASISVASGSATTPATTISVTPSISINSSGLITATASGTQSITPTVSAGYVSTGTAGTITVSGSNTSQLTTLGATTYNVSSNNQTISSGRYLTGNQTIRGVTTSGLTAANIASGITVKVGDSADDDRITSVTGTFTSDANATATDIVSGKSGYVNGTKINGSLVVNNYYTGTNAPSSSLGSNGDLYFQTSE